jgi:hypothetical protein
VHALAEAISAGKQKVSARDFEQQAAPTAETEESLPEEDLEHVEPAAAVEPVTEGETVPVPTGDAPAKEGAEITDASEAALGDPTPVEGEEA